MARIGISISPAFLILLLILSEQLLSILFVVASSLNDELNTRHLTVAFTKTFPAQVQIIRDSNGHIIDVSGVGPLMLSWLSLDYNFTWSILQTKEDLVVGLGDEDDTSSSGKLRYYLENGMCDLVVGTIVPIHSRFEWMDFLHGHMDGSAAMIIKRPELVNENIHAIAKPFQPWVWTGLFLALVFTLYIVNLINRYLKNQTSTKTITTSASAMGRTELFYYVIRVILNQSVGFLKSKRLAIRLIAGSWCLLAFVFVHAYQSVLISYILAPGMEPPIIDSLTDLVNKTDVQLLVEKGMPIDAFFTSYANSCPSNLSDEATALENVYRSLGQRLDEYPESRCNSQQRCVDLVKGGNAALVRVTSSAVDIIEKDFQDSGNKHCNLALAKGKWCNTMWGWAVPKNSPYTEALNRGILRMNAEGLPEKWRLLFQRNGNRCEKDDGKSKRDQRITLKNISGSFVVLVVGMFSSLLAFIVELLFRRRESATVDVLTVVKTADNDGKMKSALMQPLLNHNTDAEAKAALDNESSAIVISSAIPLMLTPELIKIVSIVSICIEKAENGALIEEQTADDKVNKSATPSNEEVVINAMQSPIIAMRINEQRE